MLIARQPLIVSRAFGRVAARGIALAALALVLLTLVLVLIHMRDLRSSSGKANAGCVTVAPVIEFDAVHASRGGREVLRDVSFRVEPGETLALVGRSGAGKSTVLKLINRMLEPYAGRVVVDGRDTRAWEATSLRRHTGYVLQDVGLFPHMTVSRNVELVPSLAEWPRERIAARTHELLELVGLPPADFAARWPDQLSGGQRQRVGVARALAIDPPIVLMDEPFGALDAVTRAELHREFRRIQQRLRKTVVLVTHDMREAFSLADRIGVLDDGRLVACDARERLQASSEPAVRTLLAASS
jgi:osmoprotectant transport system ATP-binding protein